MPDSSSSAGNVARYWTNLKKLERLNDARLLKCLSHAFTVVLTNTAKLKIEITKTEFAICFSLSFLNRKTNFHSVHKYSQRKSFKRKIYIEKEAKPFLLHATCHTCLSRNQHSRSHFVHLRKVSYDICRAIQSFALSRDSKIVTIALTRNTVEGL